MSKRVRSIIIAAVVLAVVAGICAVLLLWPEKEVEQGNTSSSITNSETTDIYGYLNVYQFEKEQVRDIVVDNEFGGYTLKYLSKDKFEVKGAEDYPVGEEALSAALESAMEISATKVIAEDGSNLALYGLEKPTATVTMNYSTGEKITAKIGDTTASGQVYVYLVENNKVYLTDSSWSEVFKFKLAQVASLYIVDPIATDSEGNEIDPHVTKITYSGPALKNPIVIEENPEYVRRENELSNVSSGQTIEASVQYSQFVFTSPMKADIANDAFDSKQYDYYATLADDVYSLNPTASDRAKCGLATPRVNIAVTDVNGGFKLSLGNTVKVGEEEYYYVTASGKKPIFMVKASVFSFFEEDLINYMSPIVFNVMIDDVKSITFDVGGKTYVFEESGTEDALVVRYNGKKMSTEEYRDLYQLVMQTYCEESVQPGQYSGKADVRVTYRYRDREKVDTVEYVKVATRKYMIRRNGSDIALVRSKYVDTLVYGVEQFVAGKDVPSAY